MVLVNIADIKARLSMYVERAARGEHIVIGRHNRPVASLGPIQHVRAEPRPVGPLPGRPSFDVPQSFFAPLDSADLDRWDGAVQLSAVEAEKL